MLFRSLIGWVLTDGFYVKQYSKKGKEYGNTRIGVVQSERANPDKVKGIDALFYRLEGKGVPYYRGVQERTTQVTWVMTHDIGKRIRRELPDKLLTPKFLQELNWRQLRILYHTMLLGDEIGRAHV